MKPESNQNAIQTSAPRSDWVKPQVQRIRAGEAELGATPRNPEGLAMGS